MRTRNIIAAGLAVLLMTATSWASACDLSCALRQMSGCATSFSAGSSTHRRLSAPDKRDADSSSENGAMPDMAMSGMHCDHAGEQAAVAQSVAAVTCASQPCDKASMSASPTTTAEQMAFSRVSFVAAAVFHVVAPSVLAGSECREAPPPKLAAVSPLSISLRI